MKILKQSTLGKLSRVYNEFHGEVDGVFFDLRHPELPASDWRMPLFAGEWICGGERPENAPFIWFPWFGEFSKKRAEEDIAREIEGFSDTKISKAKLESRLRKIRFPDAIVEKGDTVKIARVEIEKVGPGLKYKQDNELRYGQLEILKARGTKTILEERMLFFGRLSSLRDGQFRIFEIISGRICEHFGIQSLLSRAQIEQIVRDDQFSSKYGSAGNALLAAQLLAETYQKLRENADWLDDELGYKDFESGEWSAVNQINSACLIGYLWAYAEADTNMGPPALAALSSRAGAVAAGKKSGATRRALAATTWEPQALRLAIEFRKADPRLTQDHLAERIEEELSSTRNAKEHATIKRFISRMEKAGKLNARERRSRGHANGPPLVDTGS